MKSFPPAYLVLCPSCLGNRVDQLYQRRWSDVGKKVLADQTCLSKRFQVWEEPWTGRAILAGREISTAGHGLLTIQFRQGGTEPCHDLSRTCTTSSNHNKRLTVILSSYPGSMYDLNLAQSHILFDQRLQPRSSSCVRFGGHGFIPCGSCRHLVALHTT